MWKYIAIDESNHGRSPEIFVATYSKSDTDGFIDSKANFPKYRKKHRERGARLNGRDYRFIIADKTILNLIPEEVLLGSVVSSFVGYALKKETLTSPFTLLIDGEMTSKKIEEIYHRLRNDGRIKERDINLISGGHLDQRNQLVNISDERAHALYRQPLEKIVGHNRRLILEIPERLRRKFKI